MARCLRAKPSRSPSTGLFTTNVSVDGSGNWTVDTNTPPNSGALGALVAGEAYDVTAVVTDAAGNTSADQTGGEFRKTAPPTKSGEGLFEYTVPGGTFAGGGGGGGGPLTYTAGTAPAGGGAGAPTPLPGWLVFDPGTQTFSGNPPDRATSPLVVRVTATDGAGKTSYTDLTFTFTNTNDAPVITNVPAEPWGAAMGGATKLPSVRVDDHDGDPLTVTVTTTAGTLGGLADADPSTPGIQLTGSAQQINDALARATISLTATIREAVVTVSATDGVVAGPVLASYTVRVGAPMPGGGGGPIGGGGDGGGTLPPDDGDGIPSSAEDQVPGLANGNRPPVRGDGNGDGIKDSAQGAVTSTSFLKTDTAVSKPAGALPTPITLVADSRDGKIDSTDTGSAHIKSLEQGDAPADLPAHFTSALGLVTSSTTVAAPGVTETFSLYIEPGQEVNGYWQLGQDGVWVNLAAEGRGGKVVEEGGKQRLDFQITDGGAFDLDGEANGVIVSAGNVGHFGVTASLPNGAPGQLAGSDGDDVLRGGDGNDVFTPGRGSDTIHGGLGLDTVVLGGGVGDYDVSVDAAGVRLFNKVTGDVTRLQDVERVAFAQNSLALDLVDGAAGTAARLLAALAGPDAVANQGLVGVALALLDGGMPPAELAALGLSVLGMNDDMSAGVLLWTNVVGSAPTPDILQGLSDYFSAGNTAADLALLGAGTDLVAQHIDLVGLAATGLEFVPASL